MPVAKRPGLKAVTYFLDPAVIRGIKVLAAATDRKPSEAAGEILAAELARVNRPAEPASVPRNGRTAPGRKPRPVRNSKRSRA